MAERASLKRQIKLVNQVAAFTALFLLASCGGNEEEEVKTVTPTREATLSAPIVWQTSVFEDGLTGFAISETSPLSLMLALDDNGLQLIDSDGAPLHPQRAPYIASALTAVKPNNEADSNLRLFFGVDKRKEQVSVYMFEDGMEAPADPVAFLDGDPIISDRVGGICSANSISDEHVAKLAYWNTIENTVLVVGEVKLENNEFSFVETNRIPHDKYITSCSLDGNLVATGGGFGVMFNPGSSDAVLVDTPDVPVALSALSEGTAGIAAMVLSNGEAMLVDSEGKGGLLEFDSALRAEVPKSVEDISLSRSSQIGSLPNGFLALESNTTGGSQIIFVDLKKLIDQL